MALCGIIKHHDKNEKPCVLGFWHFLTSERIAGFSASLSAINIDFQWFAKFVHENVHETPDFTQISGVFMRIFRRILFFDVHGCTKPRLFQWFTTFSVYNYVHFPGLLNFKHTKKPGCNSPANYHRSGCNSPFRNNDGAKVMNLIQNLA